MGVDEASYQYPLYIEEQATMPLAGGVSNMDYQCGMLWGAALSAGAQAYRLYGAGPKAETAAIIASQKLVAAFRHHTKNEINCLEISHLDMQEDFDAGKILIFFLKVDRSAASVWLPDMRRMYGLKSILSFVRMALKHQNLQSVVRQCWPKRWAYRNSMQPWQPDLPAVLA